MRPIPVHTANCHGSASRRRHSFVAVPVAKPTKPVKPSTTTDQKNK